MLASLLPGLREVRTPLTVGYLWLLVIWLAFADKIPTERPAGDNLIARLFDLGGMLGQPATVAALTFLAYVLGALITIPIGGPRAGGRVLALAGAWERFREGRFRRGHLPRKLRFRLEYESEFSSEHERTVYEFSSEYERTRSSFDKFIWDEIRKLAVCLRDPNDDEEARAAKETAFHEAASAVVAPLAELRPRLLVANQEVYGEYDRCAAEADFRVNLCPPIIALAILMGINFGVLRGVWSGCALALVAVVLLIQGATRLRSAGIVLMRAVLVGTVEHPVSVRAREVIAEHVKT